jgi:hypothetical protein
MAFMPESPMGLMPRCSYLELSAKIKVPQNTIISTIPIYNIGGALNRNSTTRANQDGPEIYGLEVTEEIMI